MIKGKSKSIVSWSNYGFASVASECLGVIKKVNVYMCSCLVAIYKVDYFGPLCMYRFSFSIVFS